jgi:hypothetical protein
LPRFYSAVERRNGACRYEVYACANLLRDIDKIAKCVEASPPFYNQHGSHRGLPE